MAPDRQHPYGAVPATRASLSLPVLEKRGFSRNDAPSLRHMLRASALFAVAALGVSGTHKIGEKYGAMTPGFFFESVRSRPETPQPKIEPIDDCFELA